MGRVSVLGTAWSSTEGRADRRGASGSQGGFCVGDSVASSGRGRQSPRRATSEGSEHAHAGLLPAGGATLATELGQSILVSSAMGLPGSGRTGLCLFLRYLSLPTSSDVELGEPRRSQPPFPCVFTASSCPVTARPCRPLGTSVYVPCSPSHGAEGRLTGGPVAATHWVQHVM